MRQVTCSLDPAMDPYGIPQAVIMLDNMSEELFMFDFGYKICSQVM
ncbi:hypothetical protein Gotri_014351 [Gossypium trilobum]|uniref:Uncharacterized protein n=1 Tax=Gossypium trilobum TaxID=34281 RepID=A0A7J9DXM3_9ROSI|nr:hypothetical protein [Gossypium trilobum]